MQESSESHRGLVTDRRDIFRHQSYCWVPKCTTARKFFWVEETFLATGKVGGPSIPLSMERPRTGSLGGRGPRLDSVTQSHPVGLRKNPGLVNRLFRRGRAVQSLKVKGELASHT